VVRPNGTVEIRKVAISRDLGSKLEISQGLSESDQIINNAPPGLVDGAVVNVVSGNEFSSVDRDRVARDLKQLLLSDSLLVLR
jgi:hypothetical protein